MIIDKENIEKFKPAVNKKILYLLAGIMWMIVGIMLMKLAYKWLFLDLAITVNSGLRARLMALLTGAFLGNIIFMFGFGKIADKNISRIKEMDGKRCFFSFIAWKSYILIAFMIFLGVTLRHSSLNKVYLAIIYISIGLGLFLASFKYFMVAIKRK